MHNERANAAPLIREIHAALQGIEHEIIAVDDGSDDGTDAELFALVAQYPVLRIVVLARRAGQSAATVAGFEAARGAILVTMDADGQHDPRDIPRLLELLEGPSRPDAVAGVRAVRHDSIGRRWQSRVANAIRDRLTGDRVRDSACAFRVIRRDAVVAIPRFDGMHRFLPTLLCLSGRTVIQAPINHRPRRAGVSKYGLLDRAWRGLLDSLGVRWLKRRALRYEVRSEK